MTTCSDVNELGEILNVIDFTISTYLPNLFGMLNCIGVDTLEYLSTILHYNIKIEQYLFNVHLLPAFIYRTY